MWIIHIPYLLHVFDAKIFQIGIFALIFIIDILYINYQPNQKREIMRFKEIKNYNNNINTFLPAKIFIFVVKFQIVFQWKFFFYLFETRG